MKKNISELLNESPEGLKSQSIVNVWRLFSETEFEEIPNEKIDEESDGDTYLELINGMVLGIYPNTEQFTLDYEYLELLQVPKEAKFVSENLYWKKRIGKKIFKVEGIYGSLPTPYGMAFELEGGYRIELKYVSESEYTFDALIIN